MSGTSRPVKAPIRLMPPMMTAPTTRVRMMPTRIGGIAGT